LPSVTHEPYIYTQTEGIGTVRSGPGALDLQDDGPSSDDEDEDEDDLLAPSDGLTPTTSATDLGGMGKTPPQKSGGGLAKFFPAKRLRSSRTNSFDSAVAIDSSASTPTSSKSVATQDVKEKKRRPGRSRKARGGEYSFNPENDVLGIVMLEIKGASDLPKLSNSTYTRNYHVLH